MIQTGQRLDQQDGIYTCYTDQILIFHQRRSTLELVPLEARLKHIDVWR
jgi:hypothetical protein